MLSVSVESLATRSTGALEDDLAAVVLGARAEVNDNSAAAPTGSPHQIQCVARIAARTGNQQLARRTATGLTAVASHRILHGDDHQLDY